MLKTPTRLPLAVTRKEAAELLSVSVQTIALMVDKGQLKEFYTVSTRGRRGHGRITMKSIQNLLDSPGDAA